MAYRPAACSLARANRETEGERGGSGGGGGGGVDGVVGRGGSFLFVLCVPQALDVVSLSFAAPPNTLSLRYYKECQRKQ